MARKLWVFGQPGGVAIHGVLTYAFEDFSGLDFTVAVMDSALFQKISN